MLQVWSLSTSKHTITDNKCIINVYQPKQYKHSDVPPHTLEIAHLSAPACSLDWEGGTAEELYEESPVCQLQILSE